MSARLLLATFETIYLLGLTVWAGSIVFFTFGVVPVIFRTHGAESGGKLVNALFSRYYAWGATAGAVSLAAFVCGPLSVPELRGRAVAVQTTLILVCTLIMLYGSNSLNPAISAARASGPASKERYERLYRRSIGLNCLVLAIAVGLLIAFANRPVPTTPGIIEPTPSERVRLEQERLRKDREERSSEIKPGVRVGLVPSDTGRGLCRTCECPEVAGDWHGSSWLS